MNSGNYENKILDAIQRIVDNAVSHASYDKTIKGMIVKVADEDTGKYLIKYQDSSFYAYSNDNKISYSVDDMVYVLIPGNDMTQMKTIIGAVDKIGMNYIDTLESQDAYDIIGNNIIDDHGNGWGLCSYKPSGDTIVLYDKDNLPASFLDIDAIAANTYLKQAKYLMFGGNFQTMLDPEQKFQGNFGLALELSFLDNNTGETVDRIYKIDINEMTGNPYEYLNAAEQFVAFQIDGENFQSINKITFFSYDFPIEDEEKTLLDIFASNIFLKGADKLSEDELRGNSIKLITPQGIYFDNNDAATASRSITAEVRIDGTLLSNNSNRTKYYWFRQNSKVSRDSETFQRYGGIGWECLNEYTTITEEGVQLREWTPASANFSITKGNSLAKENVYKCVAVYNDNIILSKEITFYNYSSAFDITVTSDSGEYFSYDVGNPTLTCYVNGSVPTDTQSITWTYAWMVKDNNNIDSLLTETTSDNTTYNNAVAAYNELKTGLENGTILLTQETQEQLVSLANTISGYDSIMRVEANNIYKVKLNTITNFSTYTCFVYRNNIFVGKASITITNDLAKNRNAYTLVINNGNQVFKYNENGIAPTSKSLDKVQELYPLSFTLFDDAGKEIDNNAIKARDVEWIVPTTNTLINISPTHGNPSSVDTINETATYKNYKELYFTIANIYNANKDRNTIQLKVKYKDRVVVTKTDLLFMKEGEVGTNGTDFVCRIIPNAIDNIIPKYPTVIYNKNAAISATNPRLNFTPASENLWFKAELWHDGVKIFDGVTTGQSGESKQVKVEWEMLKNKYASNVIDVSNFIVNKTTGAFEFNNLSAISDTTLKANPANIVKCTLTYDGIEYYATMPITLVTTTAAKYRAELEELSGFRYVMYTTDGAKPIYDSANPFALRVYQTDNNIEQDISQTILSDYSVDYTWSVKGLSYGASSWNAEANLIEKTLYSDTLEKNQKRFIPIDVCNGYAVNNALYCSVTRNGTELMNIHIPIHLYLNKYGNAALNGWDGNHIEINEDGGFILAPQIGAGKKNQDNSFTGVFMGSVKEAGKSKEEYGLYGYNAGERTIALNAEDGSARFGKAGMGQIVLDPTDNTATLKSSGYVAPVLDEYGNIITPGQGLEIDLTDPHITFGSGNFRVDSDGQVYATGFATIAALNAGDIDIPGTENFKLEYATDTVQIETDANLDPIETTVTKTITCRCLYKNSYTSDYTVNLIDENGNVITHNANSDGIGVSVSKSGNVATITFTALSSRQISHAVNSYLFRFTYTQKANTKIDKTFNANLVIQGKDGERGATGPVGPAGRDGTSVTVKGSYNSLSDLTTAASTGIITPVAGDGYIIGNDLYVFTNGASGGGSQAGDWTDVGQFKGDDAKNCVIAASAQVFKSTDGTNYAPNNITLTPYLWAVTFDKWQYIINNGTPQDLNGTLPTGISINSTTKVLTITKDCALFNNSSAITFKCLTDDNNVYDTVTIIKVTDGIDGEDGSDGESAYNVILTNEAQTIAGDNTKALATTITTGVIGYLGSTKKNTSIGTITIKDTSGQTIPSSAISASVSNNNTQNTTITFTVTNQLTAKNGQATIPVTIDGTTINKIFTFSLALKGSDGKGITTVTNYYATSNNGSTAPTGSAWKTDISQLTPLSASNKYLWNYESVAYTSGDPVTTDPAVIGVYGDTGLSSTDGMPNIPPIRRWTFDKVTVKVINNEAKNCYLENNNDAYNFIQQGSGQIINQYSMAVFDGTQVVRTNSSNIDFNNDFSISFWLNPANINTTQTILQNRTAVWNGFSIFLINKQLRFDNGGGQNTFNYNLSANTNYHIVVTYNKTNGQKKLYINGVLQQTIAITHTDQTFTNYLWIGKSSADGTSFGSNLFRGTLDDLRIYDYILDLDNVDFLYRSNGQEAANGDNGRGLSSVVEYYLAYNSNEGVTKGTSGWTTSIQTVTSSNKYLWNYERINYTDGSWSETSPVIIGTYGDKGDKGDTGDSAVNILLTNEAQVIAGDTSKAIATEITTDVLGFIGSTQVATTVTATDISGLPTGMTATVSNHDNISTITFNVTTSMTNNSGQITIPVKVTVNNVEMTINKIFSYSLSLKGATGGAGTDASLVDISASSQIFKSTDGGINFAPNNITLTPRFQTVTYSKWQYTIDGGSNWTDVTSGSHGLTISGNNLTISKDSDLYTESLTAIPFKCVSSNSSIYDVITIAKLYDVGDFEIGGKNLLLKAQVKIYGSGTSGESLDNSNYLYNGGLVYTRPAVSNQGFYVTQYNLMEPDTDYIVSFKARVTNGTVDQFYMFGTSPNNIASSYLIIDNVKKSTNAKDTSITVDLTDGKYHNFIWGFRTNATITTGNYTGNILQWNKTNATAFTIELKELKWERGSKPTDWSPAPEDINANITAAQTTADSAQTLATQVQTDLNNLSIGVRNYLSGYIDSNGTSTITRTKWNFDGYEADLTAPSGYRMSYSLTDNTVNANAYINSIRTNYLSKLGIVDGDQITVSFYIKSDSTTINQKNNCKLECLVNSKEIEIPTISTEWQRCSWTGVYSSTTQYQALYIIQNQKWSSMAVGEHIYISSIKIEKGTKPTDWTRSQEDVNNAIGQAVKTITELYYLHTSSSSAPTAPTEHVTSTSTSAGVWTTKCPTWSSGKYYWTCSEILYASGDYAWTTPLVVNGLNSANSTANTANTTANAANDKINNLKVGGTNILKNSNASFINTNGALYFWTKEGTTIISQYTSDSTYNPCFKINVTTAGNRAYQTLSNVWKNGKIYTVSGFVKASAAGQIQFSRSGEDYSTGIDATTSWTYFSTTITSTTTATTGTLSVHCKTANVDFYLANLKFEEGNTPTAWSPSPLDEMSSVDVEYYLSTSSSTVTGDNWSSTAPAWSSGKFLWTRNKITWKNTAITYTNAVLEKLINNANELGTTANDKIDNMEIGGRNYLLNSSFSNTMSISGSANKYKISTRGGIYTGENDTTNKHNGFTTYKITGSEAGGASKDIIWNPVGYPSTQGAIQNKIAYFSFWAKALEECNLSARTGYGGTPNRKKVHLTTEWQRFAIAVTGNSETSLIATGSEVFQSIFYIDKATTFWLSEVKLELSSKPTDWSPAPEDMDEAIAKTVATVDVEYYLSTSSSEATGGSWSTSAPTWVDGKYMWSRQKVTYVDGTSTTRNETCIAGAKGNTGTSITISSTSVTYQASSSGTTTPTGTWSTTVPSVSNGQFLWTRTIVTYSDNTKTTAYAVAYKGTNGTNGTNSYTYIRYSASADGTDMSTDPTGKSYIGVYTGTSSTAPSSKTSYIWSKYVGNDGAAGNGITSISYYYKTTTTQTAPSASSITSTTIPTLSATNKYLWQKEVIDFSDSSVADKTTVLLLGVYGDTGVTGTGISSITEQYYLSTSKTSQTGGSWGDTPPQWEIGKYIWTRSKIVYTNPSSTTYTTPLCSSEWEAINEIKVGGRNLLLETGNPISGTGTGGTNQTGNLYKFSPYYMENYYSKTATAGQSLQVTISYDWTSTATSGTFRTQLGGYPYTSTNTVTLSSTNTSGHVSQTLTITKSSSQDTSYSYITRRFDNVTGDITFSNFKIEIGNKETDWSLAPEDVASDIGEGVIFAVAQYAAHNSNITPPPENSSLWNENTPTTSETNKYIWMRMYITYINGEDYISTPICISYYERKLIRTSIEYAASTSSTTAPTSGWGETKPSDTTKYIWTREANYYSLAPLVEYSTPACDTLVKTLQNNITNSAKEIVDGLQNLGTIRTFEDKMYVINNPVIANATQAILISSNGIAFARNTTNNPLGWDETNKRFTNEANWTSTWSIEGNFNAQNVNVINLKANEIQDGILSLGKDANTNGHLEIYTTNGQTPTITADGSGIIIKDGNVIKAKLLRTGGLIIYDKSGAKAYGSTSDETAFETNRIVVKKEIDFGTDIKGLVMEASVNSITHKGIGFIKM